MMVGAEENEEQDQERQNFRLELESGSENDRDELKKGEDEPGLDDGHPDRQHNHDPQTHHRHHAKYFHAHLQHNQDPQTRHQNHAISVHTHRQHDHDPQTQHQHHAKSVHTHQTYKRPPRGPKTHSRDKDLDDEEESATGSDTETEPFEKNRHNHHGHGHGHNHLVESDLHDEGGEIKGCDKVDPVDSVKLPEICRKPSTTTCIILLIVTMLITAETFAAVIYATGFWIGEERDDSITTTDYYYFFDAVVASSGFDSTVSLEEMVAAANCGSSEEEKYHLEADIPGIIDRALALDKSSVEQARIVDFTDQTFEISENFQATIRAVTLACITVYPWSDKFAPGAYAARVVASTYEDDISFLMEANVLEMNTGLLFIPKKHCFDFKDTNRNVASENENSETTLWIESHELSPKPIIIGGRAVYLKRNANVVRLFTNTEDENAMDLVPLAYKYPKAELLGIAEAVKRGNCTGPWERCLNVAKSVVEIEYGGLTWDGNASDVAVQSLIYMQGLFQKWFEGFFKVDSSASTTPLIFDSSIASWHKNSINELEPIPLIPSFVDPSKSQNSFILNISSYADNDGQAALCVYDNTTAATSPAANVALWLRSAIARRLVELQGTPSDDVSDWFIDMNSVYRNWTAYAFNEPLMTQTVAWDGWNLREGNLTEKEMGRIANWLMINDFSMNDQLKELNSRQRTSAHVYEHAGAGAVENDHRCHEAAKDTDIFVLVLAMVAAICGAATTVIESIHLVLHWGHNEFRGDGPCATSVHGISAVFPPYELCLMMLGAVIFFALYVPFIVQVNTEFQVHNYKGRGKDMIIHNSERLTSDHMFYGVGTLVTLVYAETECIDSRPYLLAFILVTGFVLGVLMNLPYVHIFLLVMGRYMKRLRHLGEYDIPLKSCIYERNLRIFLKDGQLRTLLDNHTKLTRAEDSNDVEHLM